MDGLEAFGHSTNYDDAMRGRNPHVIELETSDRALGTVTLWINGKPLNFRSIDEWKLVFLLNFLKVNFTHG